MLKTTITEWQLTELVQQALNTFYERRIEKLNGLQLTNVLETKIRTCFAQLALKRRLRWLLRFSKRICPHQMKQYLATRFLKR